MPEADRTTPQTVRKKLRKKKPRPAPKPAPRSTPVSRARAQERQYGSQGKAVEKVANQQRRTRQRTAGPPKPAPEQRRRQLVKQAEREGIVSAKTRRGRKYVRTQDLSLGEVTDALRAKRSGTLTPHQLTKKVVLRKNLPGTRTGKVEAAGQAPVLKVLEQTTRPLHAVAGAAKQGVKEAKAGRPPVVPSAKMLKAATRGLQNKDKTTFSDVLKEAGVKNKAVAGTAGFALDVALDPTTYVSGGTTAVAKSAALSAGRKAEKKALAKGLSKEQAARFGERAAKQAARKAGDARGVTVRVAGRDAPGVAKVTAKAGGAVKRATDRPKVVRKTKNVGRHVAADFNPRITPDNLPREAYREVRRAARTARSSTAREVQKAKLRAEALRKQIGAADQEILDAIESGSLRGLSPAKRAVAKRLRDQFKYMRRMERRAGIKVGEVKHRKVDVPKITADVEGAQKALRSARVTRSKIEREERRQVHKAGVAEGRAKVLVGQAERKATRKKRRTTAVPSGTKPRRTLAVLERERGKLYSMEQGNVITRARQAVRDAEAHLETVKAEARQQRAAQARALRRAEEQKTAPKGYVPHALREPLEKGEGIQSAGANVIRPGFAKGRQDKRTLAEIRKTAPEKYSEDVALLYANRLVESAVTTNKARLNRRLLDVGRRVRRGDEVEIGEGEKVFRIVGSDIKPVEKAELQRFVNTGDGGKGGQHVILNEQAVNRAIKQVVPTGDRSAVGELFDKGQGGWKWLATVPNPGFHIRNLTGDAQNAFLAEPARKLARNTAQSARALKRVGAQEEALRAGKTLKLKQDGIKIRGEKVTYDNLIREAESVGAIRAGFINREIPDLIKSGAGVGKTGKVKGTAQKITGRPGRSVKRFIQDREDLFRLATYIGARKRGLDPERAAERAAKFHFDYADLTELERKYARRLMPFYTFSARNIPLQLTSFFAQPGKFAQYQKIREEIANAFGVDLDKAEEGTAEYEQRAAPAYIKWKGKEFTLSFGPSGLPLTDLNEMPVSTNPAKAADEWMNRAMSLVTPVAKTPVELWSNFSFFFRDQIERDTGPLVGAPSWVKALPKSVQDDLGVVEDYADPRSGKKGLGWPAKVDYVAHLLPGPLNYINRVTTASDRKGQGTLEKSLAYGGLRVAPVDPVNVAVQEAYEERAKVGKKLAAMRQRTKNGAKISAANPTPEYRRLLDEHKRLTDEIEAGRLKRGDKIVRKVGRPKKIRRSSGGSGGATDVFGRSSSTGSSGGTDVFGR